MFDRRVNGATGFDKIGPLCFRLFNYGIGIHLLEVDDVPAKKGVINPKDNHISFQCADMKLMGRKLEEMNIEYVAVVVEEGGIKVDHLLFHNPDGYMIETCNCNNLPVLRLSSCPLKLPKTNKNPSPSTLYGKFNNRSLDIQCAIEVANQMMDNLVKNMFDILI